MFSLKIAVNHHNVFRQDGTLDYTKCMKLFPFIKQSDVRKNISELYL